ncbi:MAG: IS21 family transposase [Firmicutes bacterium]|nr:IS21 family transposase [Bacillota bacterium]
MKQIIELYREGHSIREIVRRLGVARNTVRWYLRNPGLRRKERAKRPSKLDPFVDYIKERLAAGVFNCAVLLRELKERGYTGGYTILKEFVKPFREVRSKAAVMRYETPPGRQAQVDWGRVTYRTADGRTKSLWVFVMTFSWSRVMYVEFVERADVGTFIRCHIHAFTRYGRPEECLYDNAKVVVLGRGENGLPVWNAKFLDFALRMGFDIKLCRPYRAETKGKVESGVKYVKGNFWPGVRFVDLADLNRQAQVWVDTVANTRVHGTTHERPVDRWAEESKYLQPCPPLDRLVVFLFEERKVGRDGYVKWNGASYGVPWRFAGRQVMVKAEGGRVEIWAGGELIACHGQLPPGKRATLPGQWDGLPKTDNRPPREALAVQLACPEVQVRPLTDYALLEVGR